MIKKFLISKFQTIAVIIVFSSNLFGVPFMPRVHSDQNVEYVNHLSLIHNDLLSTLDKERRKWQVKKSRPKRSLQTKSKLSLLLLINSGQGSEERDKMTFGQFDLMVAGRVFRVEEEEKGNLLRIDSRNLSRIRIRKY